MFDCTVGAWQPLPPMSVRRQRPQVAICCGKVYVVGGCYGLTQTSKPKDVLEAFDVTTSSWEIIRGGGSSWGYNCNVTLATMDGLLYLVDSYWAGAWSPELETWTRRPALRDA